MTVKARKVVEQFTASLTGAAPERSFPTSVTFRIIRGGAGCIVRRVEDMIVRLSEHVGLRIAKQLVVREPEEVKHPPRLFSRARAARCFKKLDRVDMRGLSLASYSVANVDCCEDCTEIVFGSR